MGCPKEESRKVSSCLKREPATVWLHAFSYMAVSTQVYLFPIRTSERSRKTSFKINIMSFAGFLPSIQEQISIMKEKRMSFGIVLVSLLINLPVSADNNVLDGHQYVDLALPSGTMWAGCNIGATSSLQYGSYFAWGEVKPKVNTNDYTVTKYKFNKVTAASSWNITKYSYKLDKKKVLDEVDDAARANWGKNWKMPTKEQFDELKQHCEWTYGYVNNIYCYKVTGKNGNYILFPLPGEYSPFLNEKASQNSTKSEKGFYWSCNLSDNYDSDVICLLLSVGGNSSVSFNSRVRGCSVRPVMTKEASDSILGHKATNFMQQLDKSRELASKDNFPFTVCTYYLNHSREDDNQEKLFNEIMKLYPNLRYSKSLDDAANSGDTEALFLLGCCYFRGLNVGRSKEESRKCFISAAEKGDSRCSVMLFTLELADRYDRPCMELLAKACLGKYPPAIVVNSILESRLKELSYLNKSQRDVLEMNIKSCVEKQYAEAEYIYGEYCENLKYLELAAEHGYIYAASRAATKLLQQQEYSRALYFAKISRKDPNYSIQGYELRQIQLYCDDPKEIAAGMYQAYLDQIYNEVETAYSKAKTKNLVTADIEVIMALRIRAKGDMANCSLANKTLAEYAEQGNVLAQEELALSYEKGWGMSSPDMTTAFSWYRKAAQKGSKKAQNYLKNKKLSW